MSKGIFITGTGTDIGKTYITGLLLKKLIDNNINAGYYKAALSGNERLSNGKLILGDCEHIIKVSGLTKHAENLVSYVYETPVSPHLASELENCPIKFEVIKKDFYNAAKQFPYIIMEGSGGIICPLDRKSNLMIADLITYFKLPILIVADAGLGTLNSVVLTVEYAVQKNISIKGIILNNYDNDNFLHEDNKKMITKLTGISVLACIGSGDTDCHLNVKALCELFEEV